MKLMLSFAFFTAAFAAHAAKPIACDFHPKANWHVDSFMNDQTKTKMKLAAAALDENSKRCEKVATSEGDLTKYFNDAGDACKKGCEGGIPDAASTSACKSRCTDALLASQNKSAGYFVGRASCAQGQSASAMPSPASASH